MMKDAALHSTPPADTGLAAFRAHALFPGLTSLRIKDVAQALRISDQQVLDLIEEYRDTAGATGLGAVNIRCGLHDFHTAAGGRTSRSHWRIPVAAFDAFVNERKNNQPVPARTVGRREPKGRADNGAENQNQKPKA